MSIDARRRLRTVALDLGHAVTDLPVGLCALTFLGVTFSFGILLAPVVVGLVIIAMAIGGARVFGRFERFRARLLLDVDVPAPAPNPPTTGLAGAALGGLRDGAGWRAVAYLVLKVPVSLVTTLVTFLLLGVGVGWLTYPLWFRSIVSGDEAGHEYFGMVWGDITFHTWPRALLVVLFGAVVLVVTPFVVRLFALANGLLVRALLGPSRSALRVRELETARTAAVDDSAATLRRIERDLHDGAQARLVTLAMDLGQARELLDDEDPSTHAARDLVEVAHRGAKQALTELRDLARGIHPPALDTGLDGALATLTSVCPVPTELRVDVTPRPAPAIETIAYFCVAELLANVAKHSRARSARVHVGRVADRVHVTVTDDGAGGAAPTSGSGLRGLADRVAAVDGTFTVDSPEGGPTTVRAELPASI